MKLLYIILFVSLFVACSGGETERVTTQNKSDSSKVVDEVPGVKGIRHWLLQGKYDTYRSQHAAPTIRLQNKDTLLLEGAWYISSKVSIPKIMIENPAETNILLGRKFFFEYIPELLSTRITNYKATITVKDHGRQIKLKRNETLLIDNRGNYKKFYNSYAASDTVWLTDTLVRLENTNLPTLISHTADKYGYKVRFSQSYDVLSRGSLQGSLDCRNKLKDGLEILTSTAEQSLKFSYRLENGIVYIDKPKH